jgi:hypothetical protein
MAKSKIRCPKCGKSVSRQAVACPACGAKSQALPQDSKNAPVQKQDIQSRRQLLTRILIVGLVCAALFGFIGFVAESKSSGTVCNIINTLNLNTPIFFMVAKILFALSLPVVVVSFALLEQTEEN